MTVQDYQAPAGEEGDGPDDIVATASFEGVEGDDRWGRRERHAMTVLRSTDPHRVAVHAGGRTGAGDPGPDPDEAARWDRRGHLANLSRVAKEVQIVFDPSGAVRFVDNEIRWALGYQPHEFVAQFGPEFVHPEDLLVYQDAWTIATQAFGARSRAEFRLRHADGTWRSFEASYQNLVNDPMTGGIGLHLRDVTDRRTAQEALQASEERFRALVQHSYDTLMITDAENDILFATPAVQKMFGRSPEEIIGRNSFSFVHPDDLEAAIERALRLLDTPGQVAQFEFRLRHVDQTYRWVDCTCVNLLDHPSVRGMVNCFRDITERREAEEQVRAQSERMRLLLQNADGAILVFDREAAVTWESPAASTLWGHESVSLIGRRFLRRVHPDDRAEIVRQFSKLLDAAPMTSARAEARMRTAHLEWRFYEAALTNCLDDPSINGIVANIRDTTDRSLGERALRDSEVRLEFEATHDQLTGLPNRTLLYDRMRVALGRARRQRTGVGVLFIDLDRFKVFNDSQGHLYGDRVLEAVAERLSAGVRLADTVARFGGDEFVVLAEDLHGEQEAIERAERLSLSLREPLLVDGNEVYLTVSTGLAYCPDGIGEPESLVRDADAAMYQAKELGRARVEVFDAQMRDRAVERHNIEHGLHLGLAHREFLLHYQPVIELSTGRLSGVEALVRWNHPERGLLPPDTFIGAAEATGMIVPIGAQVFDSACAQVAAWHREFPEHADLSIAINISACQLADASFTDDIASVLAATRIDPRHVHLEITESVLMGNVAASAEILDRLKVLGVRVAIDDFGTGYSSFAYLRRFPVDTLKIDKSFVSHIAEDPGDAAICASIVGIGHTLGLDVVAEGVETSYQADELHRAGCDFAQGYRYSRPVPPRELSAMLAGHRPLFDV